MLSYHTKKTHVLRNFIFAVIVITLICLSIYIVSIFLADTETDFLKLQYPKDYHDIVSLCSSEYNVNENLIFSIIRTESRFDQNAVSPAGARGLMQIMPSTFEWLQEKRGVSGLYTENDLFNPEINIKYGTYFLSILLNEYEDDNSAIAAYNAGFIVGDWLKNPKYSSDGVTLDYIPYQETSEYVRRVNEAIAKYEEIY